MKKKLSIPLKLIILGVIVLLLFIISLFVGSSSMRLGEAINALFGKGQNNYIVIMQKIRLPRTIAALVVGSGLALSGLIMQSTLGNEMASPSTLGVSNAATFGANVAIIGFAGGFLTTGNNLNNYLASSNYYSTALIAFIFAFASIIITLELCKIKSLSKVTIVLAGVAMGSIWSALTSLLQFFATDISLSAAVVWAFGDLSRATYKIDLVISICLVLSLTYFITSSRKFNALLSGDEVAKSVGVKVERIRFISLMIASLITALCVANLGIIGFVGIICPHIAKRIFGFNHKHTLIATPLLGSILLLLADTLARILGKGTAIPVGIITSIIGAPFFLYIIFRRKGVSTDA